MPICIVWQGPDIMGDSSDVPGGENKGHGGRGGRDGHKGQGGSKSVDQALELAVIPQDSGFMSSTRGNHNGR